MSLCWVCEGDEGANEQRILLWCGSPSAARGRGQASGCRVRSDGSGINFLRVITATGQGTRTCMGLFCGHWAVL